MLFKTKPSIKMNEVMCELSHLKMAKSVLERVDLDSDSQLIYLSLFVISTVKDSPLPDLLGLAHLLEIEPSVFLAKFSSLVEKQLITLYKRYEAGQIVEYYELSSTPTPSSSASERPRPSREEMIRRTKNHFKSEKDIVGKDGKSNV